MRRREASSPGSGRATVRSEVGLTSEHSGSTADGPSLPTRQASFPRAATSRRVPGETAAPAAPAFLSWRITGLLCDARQEPRALDVALGTRHRSRLFSHSPTLSDLTRGRSTRTKAPTKCFQTRCANQDLLVPARAITLKRGEIKSLPCLKPFFFLILSDVNSLCSPSDLAQPKVLPLVLCLAIPTCRGFSNPVRPGRFTSLCTHCPPCLEHGSPPSSPVPSPPQL